MLTMTDIKYELEIVDQFKGDNKTPQFLTINPTGQIPTLTESDFLVLGGYQVFVQYLASNHKKIKERFYPQESTSAIEQHLGWFMSLLRLCTGRIIKQITSAKTGERAMDNEAQQRDLKELYDRLLPTIDKQLAKSDQPYICGDNITVVDLMYYNELVTILMLTKTELTESKYPKLAVWFNQRMRSVPELVKLDKQLMVVITKYQLS